MPCFVGADIDTLCVGPRHIEHKDFFDTFYKKLAACKEVKNLHVCAIIEYVVTVCFGCCHKSSLELHV